MRCCDVVSYFSFKCIKYFVITSVNYDSCTFFCLLFLLIPMWSIYVHSTLTFFVFIQFSFYFLAWPTHCMHRYYNHKYFLLLFLLAFEFRGMFSLKFATKKGKQCSWWNHSIKNLELQMEYDLFPAFFSCFIFVCHFGLLLFVVFIGIYLHGGIEYSTSEAITLLVFECHVATHFYTQQFVIRTTCQRLAKKISGANFFSVAAAFLFDSLWC